MLLSTHIPKGNGSIDFEELKTVLRSCMDESGLKLSDDNLIELTRSVVMYSTVM